MYRKVKSSAMFWKREEQDCKMSSSPDTLWVLLTEFDSRAWSTFPESSVFAVLDNAWSLIASKPERNFLNHIVIWLWSIAPLSFTQQMFLVDSVVLQISSNT